MAYAQKADIYLFHDPDLIPVGLKLQKQLGCPCVYDIHEYYRDTLLYREWVPRPLRHLIAASFDWYEKRAVRRLAGIITVTEHMAKRFEPINAKGVVLFNYALQNLYDFPEPDLEHFKGSQEIIYVGGISRLRGFEVILEAMPRVIEKFPEARCTLVGEVDTAGMDKRFLPLEPWLQKGHIKLMGMLPYESIPQIMHNSTLALVSLLVTPNHMKAIPVKLMEYMASGLPVVASRFGHIERIVNETECGELVEAGDPQGLADAICGFIEDADKAWRCACRGWKAFRESYSWNSEEEKMIEFFRGLK